MLETLISLNSKSKERINKYKQEQGKNVRDFLKEHSLQKDILSRAHW